MAVPKLLTVKQLAAATGVPDWRWYEMFAQGKGPAFVRIGMTYRVSEQKLAEWLERESVTSTTPK